MSPDASEAWTILQGKPELVGEYVHNLLRDDEESPVARALADRLGEHDPDAPMSIRARADVASANGEFDGAIVALRQLLDATPDDVSSARQLSLMLIHENRISEARALMEPFTESHPDEPEAWMELAQISREEGEPQEARRHLRKARDVTNPRYLSMLATISTMEGDIHRDQDDLHAARDAYLHTLQLTPNRHFVRIRLGRTYRDLGQPEAALREFRRVRDRTDRYPNVDRWIEDVEDEMEADEDKRTRTSLPDPG